MQYKTAVLFTEFHCMGLLIYFLFINKVTPTTYTIVNVLFQHIDHIMSIHGTQIMQAVILILEGDHPVEVKEQVSKGQLRGQGQIIGYELEIA